MRYTFKEWHLICACGQKWSHWGWSNDMPFWCPSCGGHGEPESGPRQTVMISTDDIPGGIEIRHGICNEDGSPKRYYSKTDIKRAANEKGVTILGDTPKPYRVAWGGKREEGSS